MDTTKKKSLLADLSLFIVAIIWGTGFVVTKESLNSFPVYYLMSLRFGIATLVLLIVYRKKLKTIDKDTLKAGGIIGLFLFAGFATQTIGLQWIEAGKSAFLTATNVVIVPFLYYIVNKKGPDKYSVIASVLTLFGIMMLTLKGGYHMAPGDLMTLLCAVAFAGHIVSVGQYSGRFDPVNLVIIQMGTAAVLSIACRVLFETYPTGITLLGYSKVLYLAMFGTLACFFIQTVAQKYTSSSHAAIIMSLESVFGVIFSVILLGELLTTKMIIGCSIIFVAIIIAETKLEFLIPKKYKVNKDEIVDKV